MDITYIKVKILRLQAQKKLYVFREREKRERERGERKNNKKSKLRNGCLSLPPNVVVFRFLQLSLDFFQFAFRHENRRYL